MSRLEIVFSGVGGQGLIVGGTVLSQAATIYEDKNATLTSSYGVETRGTFTKSDVIISNEDIYYPEVMNPNLVLCLAQVAYDNYASTMKEGSILIYDNGNIEKENNSKAKQYGFPITQIAREVGNKAAVNIVSLGIIIGLTNVVSKKSIVKVLENKFKNKEKILQINIKALDKGYEIAKSNV